MELLKVIGYIELLDSITYLLYSMEEIFWIIASDFLKIVYAEFCYIYFIILQRS